MTNNTPDYEDNLYFDCNKTQANNLARNKISLTEQWKKGELPDGVYWCLSVCGDVDRLYCYQNSFWVYKTEDDYYGLPVEIKEVLAPVPSYDEWKQLKERVSKLEKMQYSYTPEEWNTMLRTVNRTKELLKECKEVFDECFSPSAKHGELYKKINEALR